MFPLLLCFLLVTVNSVPIKNNHGLQLPLKYNVVSKDVLIANQQKRLAKWDRKSKFLLQPLTLADYVTTDVSIGTPIQNFTFILSTGSIRSWVFGQGADGASPNSKFYVPGNSKNSKQLPGKFQQFDGSFNVSSLWYRDAMHLLGYYFKIQAFGVADAATHEGVDIQFPVDGVLGLGYSPPSSDKNTCAAESITLLSRLMKDFPEGDKTYTVNLNPNLMSGQKHLDGNITFGKVDENCLTKYNIYPLLSVSTNLTYGFEVVSATYDSDVIYSAKTMAYVDLGVSSVMFPASAFQNLSSIIDLDSLFDWETGLYLVSCNQQNSFGNIEIEGKPGGMFIIYSSSIVVDVGLGNGKYALALGMSDYGYSTDVFVFGIPIFRQYCIEVDTEQNILNLHDKALRVLPILC